MILLMNESNHHNESFRLVSMNLSFQYPSISSILFIDESMLDEAPVLQALNISLD